MESKSATELLKQGYNFYFNLEGQEIRAYGSYLSGREEVYVNDNLVSKKRSLNFKSHHEFKLDEDTFEVEFNVVNLLNGEIECVLIKNGVHAETKIITSGPAVFWSSFSAGILMGLAGMASVLFLMGL